MMREDRIVFDQLHAEVLKNIEVFAEQVKELLIRQVKETLIQNDKQATGDLIKSISGKIEAKVNEIIIEVFSGMGYAPFVHDPTRPHYPPIWKIRDWVRMKGLAGNFSIKTRKRMNNRMDQYWQDDQLARAIAWKISKKGTKGLKFFEIALKQAMPLIEQKIKEFSAA